MASKVRLKFDTFTWINPIQPGRATAGLTNISDTAAADAHAGVLISPTSSGISFPQRYESRRTIETGGSSNQKQVGEQSVILEIVAGRLKVIISGIKQMTVVSPRRNKSDMFQLTCQTQLHAAAFPAYPTYGIRIKASCCFVIRCLQGRNWKHRSAFIGLSSTDHV